MTNLSCPDCGGQLSDAGQNLSSLGYQALDITHICVDCGESISRGEPIGEYDGPHVDDPTCGCCDETGHLYQIHEGVEGLALRFKCPNCYHVWIVERELADGAITVGYADVMGTTDETRPYGYEPSDPASTTNSN